MKMKFPAILAIGCLVLFSCEVFSEKQNDAAPIEGRWKLDSISISKDTSIFHALALAAIKDSGVIAEFRKDLLLVHTGTSTDTSRYELRPKEGLLLIRQSSMEEPYRYQRPSGASLVLTSKDSTVLHLSKQ